jgi:heme oxygenase (biliverdin-producing, ferredoxin)
MSLIETSHLPLSKALRERTSTLHAEAERSGIVNDILRGRAGRHGYLLLLRNLLPAYRAMEHALDAHRHSPLLASFARPHLRRAGRIAADMAALGIEREDELPLLPASAAYAAAVTTAAEGKGLRLVAHAYVRYFGDMSGGLVLKRLLGKSLGIGPQALSFYEFAPEVDPVFLKDEMRIAIDAAVAHDLDREIVIAEGIRAFEHNIAVSCAVQELAGMQDVR